MKPITALSSMLLAGAVAGPVFAAATINGMPVPIPTPRPAVTELAQASDTDRMIKPQAGAGQTDSMTTGSISPGTAVGDFKAVDITKIAVMRVDEVTDEAMREKYRLTGDDSRLAAEKLQAEIRTNPDLVAALETKRVDVSHVVDVQQNADGSVTFIVM